MTECTRCGTDTTRNALTSEAPIENSENGVVWLCDSCMDDFNQWMGEKRLKDIFDEAKQKGKRDAAMLDLERDPAEEGETNE